ncbi:MAG TPA: hypothetical protein VLM79_06115 [Kofleriaceae bacterium]|nr:hypothetical protein [Kofleriaceae bacterium]
MNRRARRRLGGLASLPDPALASMPMAARSGAIERRDLGDAPIDRACLGADGVGDAIASMSDASGIAHELLAAGEVAHSDLRDRLVRGPVAPVAVAPGAGGEPLNGEAVDGGVAGNRGRVLRVLRALRTARALRLAIALGMAPGTGME